MIASQQRPHFSIAEYREHVLAALECGRTPWQPVTHAEFMALEEISPRLARSFMPADPRWRELIDLPDDYGTPADEIKPFDRLFRRRLLKTVEADPDFAQALAAVLEACE